jgi:hypothetical protein
MNPTSGASRVGRTVEKLRYVRERMKRLSSAGQVGLALDLEERGVGDPRWVAGCAKASIPAMPASTCEGL